MAEYHKAAQLAAQAAKLAKRIEKVCAICGASFVVDGSRAARTVCSTECKQERASREARRWKIENRTRHLANRRRLERTEQGRAAKRRRAQARRGRIVTTRRPRTCRDCGLELDSRALRCDRCKANHTTPSSTVNYYKRDLERNRERARKAFRARYSSDPGFAEANRKKRRRAWIADPDKQRRVNWETSIRKRFGSNLSADLQMILEERLTISRELKQHDATTAWTCSICGERCSPRRITCARPECTGEYGRRHYEASRGSG